MRSGQFRNKMAWLAGLSAVAMLLASGCAATVELAAPDEDTTAKLFNPPQDKAGLYITRKSGFAGSAILFQVVVDGRVEGGLAPGTYRVVSVQPGRHVVSVTTAENQSTQTVDAVAGECYFYEVKPKMGMFAARVEVTPLTALEGQEMVLENSLAKAYQYDE